MDYLEIVLQGYFNKNNREFLKKYFLREFKKAEKEQFFEADEFFNGCLKVIEGWEKHLQDKVFERKQELHFMLNEAKNKTIKFSNTEDGKTIEQKTLETISYCEQELKDISEDSFSVHLHSLTQGRIPYNMPYLELLQIKDTILKAFQKTLENTSQRPKSEGTAKRQLTLKDFFPSTDEKKVLEIKEAFTDSPDKDLLMLFYILDKELKLIEVIENSKTKSRQHFFNVFTGEEKKDVSYINRKLKKGLFVQGYKIDDLNYLSVRSKLKIILA